MREQEYLLAANAMDKAASELEAEADKIRRQASLYRHRAEQEKDRSTLHRDGLKLYRQHLSEGMTAYGASLKIALRFRVPHETVFSIIWRTERAQAEARRDMRNETIMRLLRRGLTASEVAENGLVRRLNGGEALHPKSVSRIAREQRRRIMAPSRLWA
jgi:hypothetical protein